MKSTRSTLKLVARKIARFSQVKGYQVKMSLIGGQAAVSHGVPRVTIDIDICMLIVDQDDKYVSGCEFADFLKKGLRRFKVEFTSATDPTDPLKHAFVRLKDLKSEYPVVDILFANYKWELEGIENSVQMKGLPLPVLSKPYLVAMKLKAGGQKDNSDILDIFELMSEQEKAKAFQLAKLIHQHGRLKKLLT